MTHSSPTTRSLLVGASANLFISAAGAGLLSYPYAVLQQGIAINALLTVVFAFLNAYTDLILAASAFRIRRQLRVFTYEETCLQILGPWGYGVAVFTVIVGCAGSIIGFMIIIGDLAQPVVSTACLSAAADSICSVVSHRAFILLFFAVSVALPLSSFERIHSLAGSSVLAALTVIVVGVLMVAKGSMAAATGEVQCSATGEAPHASDFTLWFRSSWTVFLGVPLSVFALGNHIQCVPVFLELGRKACVPDGDSRLTTWHSGPDNPQRLFHRVVIGSVVACVVLYTLTGAFGYVACGPSVKGDVLLNFPADDAFADVARAFMAIHVTLAMPVIVVPCRRSILMLRLFLLDQCSRKRKLVSNDERLPNTVDSHSTMLAAYATMEQNTRVVCGMGCGLQQILWNTILVVGGAAIAVGLPQVAVVFGLMGASVSTAQIYIFPALMLLARARQVDTEKLHHTSCVDDKQLLLPLDGSDEAAALCSTDDSHDITLPYIPTSAFWLKVHAWSLVSIAVFIGILGTASTVYSTWFQ